MEFDIEFSVGGVTFKVKGYHEEGCNQVFVWLKNHFEELSIDTNKFCKDFEDHINDAIKDDMDNRRWAAEDLAFEAHREEQMFGGK
mgnify:CR=1 FL=1